MFLGTFIWWKSRVWAPSNKSLYIANDRGKTFIWLQHTFKILIYLLAFFTSFEFAKFSNKYSDCSAVWPFSGSYQEIAEKLGGLKFSDTFDVSPFDMFTSASAAPANHYKSSLFSTLSRPLEMSNKRFFKIVCFRYYFVPKNRVYSVFLK
jgi:hypothetical protein